MQERFRESDFGLMVGGQSVALERRKGGRSANDAISAEGHLGAEMKSSYRDIDSWLLH